MVTIQVAVSEPLHEFIADELTEGGYRTASEYIQKLIQDAQQRKARERVENQLREGIRSGPATPLTADDWTDIRREVQAGLSANNGNES